MEIIKNPDYYITFKQSEFKIPVEVLKKNFKNLQKQVDKHTTQLKKLVKLIKKADNEQTRNLQINKLIDLQKSFNEKIKLRISQHNLQIDRLKIRIDRISELKSLYTQYGMKSYTSKDYIPKPILKFYDMENSIMIVNYLLSLNNFEDAREIAVKRGVSDFIDFDIYNQFNKIKHEIKHNKNHSLLKQWCIENEKNLAIVKSQYPTIITADILFKTKIQEYIELVKIKDYIGASNLINNGMDVLVDSKIYDLNRVVTLVWSQLYKQYNTPPKLDLDDDLSFYAYYVNEEDATDFKINCPHDELLDDSNWDNLCDLFEKNFKLIYGINLTPTLISLFNIGVSSIKTKSCEFANSTGIPGIQTTCPVCSIDLSGICNDHPTSFQTKSNLFDDPVLFNDHVYSLKRLLFFSRDIHDDIDELKLEKFQSFVNQAMQNFNNVSVIDPVSLSPYPITALKKIYPT